MAAPTTAAAVANAFLEIQEADNTRFPPIDQMKLQKLVYYAHAWWLAHTGEPLFDDDVEAWPWGPVVRNIYVEFKGFGREPIIEATATELARVDQSKFLFKRIRPPRPNKDVMHFLSSVWEAHKEYTGVQLSNASHASGEPWSIVNKQYGSLEDKPRIPNSLIRDVFRAKIAA